MFLFNSLRAKHSLVEDHLITSGHGGLKVSFSYFDGYSPMLEGSVRVIVVDSPKTEKSGNINVVINVKGSSPSYKDNIRVDQQENEILISTGGLTRLSYASAPRLIIDVAISLPRSIGDLEINTLSIPVIVQAIEKAGDIVLKSESSPITVAKVEARTLTVSTNSGTVTFDKLSEQLVHKFIKVTNSSGSTVVRSLLSSPSVLIEAKSGSLNLATTTTATKLEVKSSSGSIDGRIEYSSKASSVSTYENNSGSLDIKLKGWTGYLTAKSGSGSKDIGGQGLEKFSNGWKKGDGDSKAMFYTNSGSLDLEVL